MVGETGQSNTTAGINPEVTGKESSLSNWAGDYVTDMLGKGQALGNEGYNCLYGAVNCGDI